TCTTGAGCTVTIALADFVASATEVAVTVKAPVAEPAVKRPAVVMMPPVAVKVTAVLELPVTVALNCCDCAGNNVTLAGERVTLTFGLTVIFAVADFVGSATDFAVTVKLPALAP